MTKEQKEQTIGLLFAEKCSCVVRNGDEVRIFRERGVKDLYRLLREEPQLLDGAFVADKVVGKGAAALMILGGVDELFADVVSRAALDLLAAAGKAVAYTVAVPHIINRADDGICPVERLCAEAQTAGECLPRSKDSSAKCRSETNRWGSPLPGTGIFRWRSDGIDAGTRRPGRRSSGA